LKQAGKIFFLVTKSYLSLSLSLSCCPHFGDSVSVKRLFHFCFLILKTIGRALGWGISPSQVRYVYKHRINTDKHPWLEWDSNPQSQLSNGRKQFMP
jgi:hypothetical protein